MAKKNALQTAFEEPTSKPRTPAGDAWRAFRGNKIAIAPNVWADFLLWYNKGWVAHPWAFPDFRDGSYFETFNKMRKKFKAQVKTSNP